MTVAGVAGIIVLVLAWAGPLPGLVQSSFAAHMALHMLVTGVAAPLLAAGLAPLVVRRGGVAIPVMASLLDFAVIWGWHAPALHEAARTGATVLAVGALRIGKGAWDALMDRRADPAIIAGIAEIARGWPGVRGFHNLKTRTAGSQVFVNLHIELDGDQPLRQAHDIGAGLRRAILEAYPQADVIIHKDVAGGGGVTRV